MVENCLIRSINGDTIDVDKLDYIMRDTWASGVNNVTVDVHRLLAALELVETSEIRMVYNKSALSVIQNVIDGRNFLYRWVYTHHTVLYNNHLLEKSMEKMSQKILKDQAGRTFLDKIFSPMPFEQPVEHDKYCFYLPCDGDIYYFMKGFFNIIPEINEIMSRCPDKIPLWKTYAEFKKHFDGKVPRLRHLKNKAAEYLASAFDRPEDDFLVLPVKAKYVEIGEDQLFVQLSPGDLISYTDATDQTRPTTNAVEYFYVYIPCSLKDSKMACIDVLKKV